MSRHIQRFIAFALFAALAAGCAKQAPKCSDDNTYSVLRQIIMEKIGGNDGASAAEVANAIKFEFARATEFDEKVKKYSCDAKLTVGGLYELPIKYESQLDDKNDHIVFLAGITRSDWMLLSQGIREGIRKAREASGIVAKDPVPAPASPEPQAPAAATPVAEPEHAPETSANLQATPQAEPSGPSFDCAKASGTVETSICSNATLGKLDSALGENYNQMIASNIGDGARSDLKASQRNWMAARNKCADNACLEEVYRKRVDEVCEYPVIAGVHPACTQAEDIK